MATGYCTIDDVRRALREASLPGDAQQDKQILTDAIAAQTEWLVKTYKRHWYVSGGVSEDDEGIIPTSANNRNDEHDIPTHAGYVDSAYDDSVGAVTQTTGTVFDSHSTQPQPKEQVRLAFGDLDTDGVPAYTRITLARKDVEAVNTLSVVNKDGGFDDWVASNDYAGGVDNQHRGEDYWVRVNNGGVSELYLDVKSMDDDFASFSNAVYVDLDYGHEGLPRTVRRAVAFRAGADLVEEASIQIPESARVWGSIESKAEEMRSKADELLEVYLEEMP